MRIAPISFVVAGHEKAGALHPGSRDDRESGKEVFLDGIITIHEVYDSAWFGTGLYEGYIPVLCAEDTVISAGHDTICVGEFVAFIPEIGQEFIPGLDNLDESGLEILTLEVLGGS